MSKVAKLHDKYVVWRFSCSEIISDDDQVSLLVRRPWGTEWKMMPYIITENGSEGFLMTLDEDYIKVIGFSGSLWKLKVEIKHVGPRPWEKER